MWTTHGPNAAPKRRYLGTISAKLLMYLDENLPPERLNAPHLDASACKEEHKHYIRQVELVHCLPGYFSRSAQMSQKDVGAGGIHPLADATGSMLAAREVGLPVSVGIRAKGENAFIYIIIHSAVVSDASGGSAQLALPTCRLISPPASSQREQATTGKPVLSIDLDSAAQFVSVPFKCLEGI